VTAAADSSALSEQPGTTIGPYKLLEQIGEGGMGVVFMAEQQEPVRRRVALKLIKPGMDTRQVIARFEAERQALAVMDHPGIAHVLDAGATPSGHPYFVMELVRGVPITTYCDENNLPVRERLELFASVCQAIQHAHTKGIIHRDIKPNNVLVTRQDGRPAVKVIDFGVAKAIGQQLTEKTLFTNFAQMVGTPLYMSPEQAEQSGVDIDTRSDIFSLGVLLYELLTGSTPVNEEQMRKAAFDEIRRIIREDEAQIPSMRISSSDTLPAIAAHRHIEPARLSKLVRGELDWIVMKALEKDRNRRYETANAFAADVAHYLNDEHVQACPPSAAYRFGKFARRNRVALVTATLVVSTLVAGTIVSTWQAIRAETARTAEAEQRKIAEVARWAESEQRKAAETERAEAQKQRVQAEANFKRARETVDEYFTLVSESTLLDVPGLQPLRKELLDKSLQFYKNTAVERASDPRALADLAVTYIRVAEINHTIDRNDDAVAAIDQAVELIERLRSEFPNAGKEHRRLAGYWKGYRRATQSTAMPKDPAAAFRSINRLIELLKALAHEYPDEIAFRSDLAALYQRTGDLLTSSRRFQEGVVYLEEARAVGEQLVRDQPEVREYRADLARTYRQLAAYLPAVRPGKEAEAAGASALSLREQLVAESPDSPQHRADLGNSLLQSARFIVNHDPGRAERLAGRAKDLFQDLFEEYPNAVLYRSELATATDLWLQAKTATHDPQQIEEAVRYVDEWTNTDPTDRVARNQLAHGVRHVAVRLPSNVTYLQLREDLHKRSLALFVELSSQYPGIPDFVEDIGHDSRYLGWITRDAGRPDDALQHFDEGIAAFQKLVDTKNPSMDAYYRRFLVDTLLQKVDILAGAGRAEDAEKASRQVLEMYEALARDYPKEVELHQQVSLAMRGLVDLLTKNGRQQEAREACQQAIARLEKLGDDPHVRISLGTLHRDLGDVDQAIAEFSGIIDKDPKRAEVWDLRGNCYLRKGQFGKAVDDYSEAIKLQPRTAWYWHERGYAHLVLGKHEKSITDHSTAIEISDQDAGQRVRRGQSYEALGHLDKAESDYARAVELNPADWNNWYSRGRLHIKLGQQDKADADFAKATELCQDAGSLNELAWKFATSADPRARNATLAVELAKKGIELDPKSTLLPNTLGVAYYRAGNWQDAIEWLTKSMEVRKGGDSFDWFFLAMAHWQLGDKDEARKWQAKAVEWMDANKSQHQELLRFRAEAEELMKGETKGPDEGQGATPETKPSS
jgi:tetratricopeptide (TPR) repeat protein/tRNA A-37 threonylcarbamoyl transferase component Bud32